MPHEKPNRDQVRTQIASLREQLADLEAQLGGLEAAGENGVCVPEAMPTLRPFASFQTLADELPVIVWITDEGGQCVYVNRRWREFTGQTLEEAAGLGWLRCVHADDVDQARRVFLTATARREPFTLDYRLRAWNGVYHWALDVGQPRCDEAGRFLGYVGAVFDITARKQAEQEVAEGQRRLQALFDNALDAILLTDAEGRYVDANPAACALFGYSKEELLQKYAWEMAEPEHRAGYRQAYAEFVATGTSVGDFRVLCKDGSICEVEYRAVANVLPGLCLSAARDITDRRRFERSLRDSERRLKEAQRIARLGNWEVDWRTRTVLWSEEMYRLCGVTPGEYLPTIEGFLGMLPSSDREALLREVDQAIAERRSYALDHRLLWPDGTERMVSERAEIEFDAAGHAVRFVGTLLDITARHRAEEELRALNAVLENAVEGISRLDDGGVYRVVNAAYARMVGYEPRAMLGMTWEPTVHPDDQPRVAAAYQRMLAEGKSECEARGLRKDGSVFWKHVVMVRALDRTGAPCGHYCFMKDVSAQKQLEEQLLHSQKQEAIGRLAGGVAHDFNNLLTVINGYSDLLLFNQRGDDVGQRWTGEIRKAGERAAALTQQLLAYSRKALVQPVVLDLNAVVADGENMLRRLIGEDVVLRTRLAADLRPIRMDRGQLDQIILNLAVNARDAMPGGGALTLETANTTLGHNARGRMEVAPGDYVMLAVTDTGCGMDASIQAQLFEPFFTTKEVGKGTGLGLATVYGIVKQCAGTIDVESTPGRGACFRVYLPSVAAPLPQTAEQTPAPAPLPGGPETVLLVEDEDGVRALARMVLQDAGYRVLEASDGETAIELCRQQDCRVDILVTDVIMPQMSGRQLADRLRQCQPELRVLYVSGYTDDALGQHGVLGTEVDFLQKPYSPTALTNRVREMLDRRP
ncbi:MAG: PAS domain S-box protein [Planctomycetia bacterium]|nr:PAS domain S-box protein [Planctomycetia bacterium]